MYKISYMNQRAILCVDDELMIISTLKTTLKREFGESFIYEHALNAEDALYTIEDLLKKNIEIILIISDWLMPGMKGDEFLFQVFEKHPDILAVMLTGLIDEESEEKIKQHPNILKVIHKPWAAKELISVVRQVCRDDC